MKEIMKETDEPAKWLQKVPREFQALMAELKKIAHEFMQDETPYHSVRIVEGYHTKSGRVIGWCISAVTSQGWEYENAVADSNGTIVLTFKNPYIFS